MNGSGPRHAATRAATFYDKAALPSRHVTEGMQNALHRIFYYGMGLTAEEIHRAHVGVVAAWSERLPGSAVVWEVVHAVADGVWSRGGTPREFATIAGVDDARADPTGGHGLLLQRELVADSVELTVRGHCYDAFVGVASCFASLAGLVMASCRLDVPAVVLPCITEEPSASVAATMALGLGPPEPVVVSQPEDATATGHAAGVAVMGRLAAGVRPRTVVTRRLLDSAIERLVALGAPSDTVFDLLAVANECGIDLDLISWAEAFPGPTRGGSARPGLAVLQGNLSPDGCVGTLPANGPDRVEGRARVFDCEEDACRFLDRGVDRSGEIVVVRFQGPRGAPGMRRLTRLPAAVSVGAGASPRALVTDGRLAAVPGVVTVAGVGPEAALGGPLGRLTDGDPIRIDLEHRRMDVLVSDDELGRRDPAAVPGPAQAGAAWKYARTVGPARRGAVTHGGAAAETLCYADQ